MPKPITFSTEAERVKARKQYLAIDKVAWPSEQGRSAERFDAAFPPIAPPKMVSFEAWIMTDEHGRVPANPVLWDATTVNRTVKPYVHPRRVRVVEVDDE